MKNKFNFLTILNFIMFISTFSMFIFIIYLFEKQDIGIRKKFTIIELNQLKFAERNDVLESIRLINENFNELYKISFYLTNSIPMLDYKEDIEYVAYSTEQLDSIYNSCKANAKRKYHEKKYENSYSYYVNRSNY